MRPAAIKGSLSSMRRLRPLWISASDCEHFLENLATRADRLAGVNRRIALPIGKRAAGFFEDRLHGGRVPDIENRVDHHECPSHGDEHVAVAISPGASDPSRLLERVKSPFRST